MMLDIIMLLYRFKLFIQKNFPANSKLYELFILIPQKMVQDSERRLPVQRELEKFMNADKVPLFNSVEIETVNRCNGECSFCPVNRHDDKRKYKLMEEDLFKNIIYQLKEMNYDGRLQIFSNNEPLLDKRISDLVKYAKENCPNSHMSFFTNGTLLTREKFEELIPYCNTFCIDIYYEEELSIPENIKEVIDLCNKNPELKKKVIISLINKRAIRNNRGGQSKNRLFTYRLKTSCELPFKQLIIRPDGKVSLCCNDPLGTYTLGDTTKQSLLDIWNSKTYTAIRKKLFKDGRKSIDLCKNCDNFGGFGTNSGKDYIFTPAEFRKKWEKIDNLMCPEK